MLTKEQIQINLIALAPFFLFASSWSMGLSIALIIVATTILLATLIFMIRTVIPVQQKLTVLLIITTSVATILSMILNAKAYPIAQQLGVLLPLLAMNMLVLSQSDSAFITPQFKYLLRDLFTISLAVLLFFLLLGSVRDALPDLAIFSSPAGCFLLVGFLFALLNSIKMPN